MSQNQTPQSPNSPNQKLSKTPKKKGPIRSEAVIPFLIVSFLIGGYFYLFFDLHIKKALEWGGYQVTGAEVNIGSFKSSFLKAQIEISQIQLTNPDKPTHNQIEIQKIKFKALWDGLLRLKVVIDEMSVEGVAINQKRAYKGKVKPPPPPEDLNKPSIFEKAAQDVANKTQNKIEKQNESNILGGLSQLSSGKASQEQIIEQVKKNLKTEKSAQELDLFIKQKNEYWTQKLNTLPKESDFKTISNDISKIKTQDFKSPQEVTQSLEALKQNLDQANLKINQIKQAGDELKKDLKYTEDQVKQIEQNIKSDLAQINQYLAAPPIDFKNMMTDVFMSYLEPYLAKIAHYKAMAQKYMPPNLGKKDNPDEINIAFAPKPRSKGTDFEFGKAGGYPLFWIKKISLSSKANAEKGLGDMSGQILNISSHQALINKPTEVLIKADFPSENLFGFNFKGTFDNRKKINRIDYELAIQKNMIEQKTLLSSNDIQINLKPTEGSFFSKGQLVGFKDLQIQFKQSVNPSPFDVQGPTQNELMLLLQPAFTQVTDFSLNASIAGQLPGVQFGFDSDLGPKLEKAISLQIEARMAHHRQAAEQEITKYLNEQKNQIQQKLDAFKNQIGGDVKKIELSAQEQQKQIDSKKKQLDSEVDKSKKQAEEAVKKALQGKNKEAEEQLKKAAEDLKKQLGF